MNHHETDENITLYGVGISYIEALALPKTLSRIIYNTNAILYEPPLDDNDYFCYVYYIDRDSWRDGYTVLAHNFAITSTIVYKMEVSLSDLFDGLW